MTLRRLRRRHYWLLTAAAWSLFFAVREGAGLQRLPLADVLWAAIGLSAVAALTVARLHDRNRSGRWLAVAVVPVAGAAWLTWEAALRRGTPDANAYGPDPRT